MDTVLVFHIARRPDGTIEPVVVAPICPTDQTLIKSLIGADELGLDEVSHYNKDFYHFVYNKRERKPYSNVMILKVIKTEDSKIYVDMEQEDMKAVTFAIENYLGKGVSVPEKKKSGREKTQIRDLFSTDYKSLFAGIFRKKKQNKKLFAFLRHVNYKAVEPPLTEEEVAKLEELNEITLPEEYRLFLTTVGNGIKIIRGEKDVRLIYGFPRPVEKHINRRYKWDFIFETAYHDRLNTHDFSFPDDCIDIDDHDEEICGKCRHKDSCFYSDAGDFDEFDHVVYNGACPICYAGCTYFYFLILNGSHRGEVWINNEISDFSPIKKSFSEFLEWVATAEIY